MLAAHAADTVLVILLHWWFTTDLTPCDFLVRVYLKEKVCDAAVQPVEDFKIGIRRECWCTTPAALKKLGVTYNCV